MENHINFGIDLGTTNSGIGKYENGRVQVLKNPVGLREILPSVVSFYRGRTLVGDKAREQYLTNTGNVFSAFKRKMGTTENYTVNKQGEELTISPVDLSAYVLKELRNYVTGTDIPAVVITIPASFDTIQSNATKQAGYLAGFKEVVLLQEPIAACLAYANLSHLNLDKEQKWLVYDFGGGTFDAALVKINERELKVLDNKGNNFLGGVDIDHALIKHVIAPRVGQALGDEQLWARLTGKEGIYEKLWHYLNYLTEEAKKQLSVMPETWMEVDFPDLDLFFEILITQAEFNQVIKPIYFESEQLLCDLLDAHQLTFGDIERIIMVGGTTYIPYIKEALRNISGTIVDESIDPTTAIITGAAFFAGAHIAADNQPIGHEPKMDATSALDVKLSFEAYSNDLEELIAFKTAQAFNGSYRITRTDGGFDSGMIQFEQSASEFVTLLPKARNTFRLIVFNSRNEPLFETADISISHGLYSVSGQLLPEDICIELDNDKTSTYLEAVFKRNSILPLKKTLYKTFSKSIIKGTAEKVIIHFVEGKSGTLPGANLTIGYIELSGKDIDSDLIQGTDIEIQAELDESRGLKVELYIPSSGQQLTQNFHITQREINLSKILLDIASAENDIAKEIINNNEEEAYELSAMFQQIDDELKLLKIRIQEARDDRATEERYKLDERKRKTLGQLDDLTRARDVYIAISQYQAEKKRFIEQEQLANKKQLSDYQRIIAGEKELLHSADKHLIGKAAAELKAINHQLWLQNDETYILLFLQLRTFPETAYNTTGNMAELFAAGNNAMQAKDYGQLKQVVIILFNQLRDEYKILPNKQADYANKIKAMKTGLN